MALLLVLIGLYTASAVDVQLTIDGTTTTVSTRASTVRDLLIDHAVPVASGDLVVPGPYTRVRSSTHVIVQRARPARVRADGQTVRLRSHGRSALALLAEAGVLLSPDDQITVNGQIWRLDGDLPDEPADSPDSSGADVAADSRAGAGADLGADVVADYETGAGADTTAGPLLSQGHLVRTAMAAEPDAESGGPSGGAGAPDPESSLLPGSEAEWVVDVWRARSMTIVEGDAVAEMPLAGPSVGAALTVAGIELHPEDEVWPPADASLDGRTRITIKRATAFLVEADGERQTVRSVAKTVGAALDQAGLGLLGHDYAIPAADALLSPGLEVKVIRVKEDILVREVPIAFATQFQPDPNMALDDQRVDRPGEPGLKSQRIRITYEDGEEIDREIVEETVLRDPVAEVVSYGTDIVWRTVSTPQGPLRFWRQMRVYATSYSLTRSGTSPSAPWYGLTRSGLPMRHGIVAVDRRFIPFMSNLYVPEYGVGLAADTGGGIKSYHIDLGYDDDNYQSWHWPVDLYLLEPVPEDDKMIWRLP